MEIYQDIYSNGTTIKKGIRSCNNRYTILADKIFSKFTRTFSILDIGANFGYFSVRAAEEYEAISVMIQSQPEAQIIKKVCEDNLHLNLNLLDIRISANQLFELSKSEYFDVVLALNILHHIGPDWRQAAEAILNLGEFVIIETPDPKDIGACGKAYLKDILEFFESRSGVLIGKFSRHTDSSSKSSMFLLKGHKPKIKKSFIDQKIDPNNFLHNFSQISISSSFDHIIAEKNEKRWNWIPGMNLYNFLKLGGSHPTKKMILTKLENKEIISDYTWDNTHLDITPWNFIIQGQNLYLIDIEGNNKNEPHLLDDEGMNFTINYIKNL